MEKWKGSNATLNLCFPCNFLINVDIDNLTLRSNYL